MAQWSRALIDLLKTWALLPELTWQLTTVCNLQFQRIRYSLLPFTGTVHMWYANIHAEETSANK